MVSLIAIVSSLTAIVNAQVRATYHDYEGDRQRLGRSYDNSPGWCGIRYSVLNVARITAVNGMNAGLCNQCLEVQNVRGGPLVYVLAVDWKEDPGLDIARTSFAALTPGANPLDPQTVNYRVVSPSFCAGICQGTADECTPGRRNLLPAYLLPSNPTVQATYGGSGGGSTPNTPVQGSNPNLSPQRVAPAAPPRQDTPSPARVTKTTRTHSHHHHPTPTTTVTSTSTTSRSTPTVTSSTRATSTPTQPHHENPKQSATDTASHTKETEKPTHVFGSAPGRTFGVVSSSSRIAPALAFLLCFIVSLL